MLFDFYNRRLLRGGYMGNDIEFTFGYYNGKWKITVLESPYFKGSIPRKI